MRRKTALILAIVMMFTLMLPACSGGEYPEKKEGDYSIVSYPRGPLIVVADNETGYFGAFGSEGELVVPCEYTQIEHIGKSSYGDRYLVQKEGKYGFIDGEGKEVIPCEYDSLMPPMTVEEWELTDDLAVGVKDNKSGYVSLKDGSVPFESEFTISQTFDGGDLAPAGVDSGLSGYIDKKGQMVIPEKYSEAGTFENGCAIVRDENNKAGVIDSKGNTLIPCKYDDIFEYYGGKYAVVSDSDGEDEATYALVDTDGNEIIPMQDKQIYLLGNLVSLYDFEDSVYEIYGTDGKKLIDGQYSDAYEYGSAIVITDQDGMSGVLDFDGKVILPCEYIEVINITCEGADDMWRIRGPEDDLYTLTDASGKVISDGEYSGIRMESYDGKLAVLKDDKLGFIDRTGKPVVPFTYYPTPWVYGSDEESGYEADEDFDRFIITEDFAIVSEEKGGKFAFMDWDGNLLTDFRYTYVGETSPDTGLEDDGLFVEDHMVVKEDDGKCGLTDNKGHEIVPCGTLYAVGEDYDNGLILVRRSKDELWCLMNSKGEFVTDAIFNRVTDTPADE